MVQRPTNSFGALASFDTGSGSAQYFRLGALEEQGLTTLSQLPFSIRILLEALLRTENGHEVTAEDISALAAYDPVAPPAVEIPYKPARVLLQDFTGVPAVVDLAAMRSATAALGGDPKKINPLIPVDLVVDHSVQVDAFGSTNAFLFNADLEFERNRERYAFLRWGQKAFDNFNVVPPKSGICHQVNLEYLATVARRDPTDTEPLVYPDTLVGTDSHTPMIGGLGVLGWGVGGIEAEAVMLGQPLYMLAPPVVGVHLTGQLPEGATATDLVLGITELLRARGVVGKFVEFFGVGLGALTVPDRATIANMAPEYGATVGYFPVDQQTLDYLQNTGRPAAQVELVRRYYSEQGMLRTDDTPPPSFEEVVEFDLGEVQVSLSGPKRPQDRIPVGEMQARWRQAFSAPAGVHGFGRDVTDLQNKEEVSLPNGTKVDIGHGTVGIAAITSCTNTSNPSVMIAAALLAKNAVAKGLKTKPWVKTSLAPGSTVVTEYLHRTGLLPYLELLGFHVVGYGCTTCIGNSGPLPAPIAAAVDKADLVIAGVLSGNRNFEGRINPHVRANYLASPPLVVAYALSGTVDIDLTTQPLGQDSSGQPVMLKDIWPSADDVARTAATALSSEVFIDKYTGIEMSNDKWNDMPASDEPLYPWHPDSTYIQEPPFFANLSEETSPIHPIENARVLVMVGDSTTTDHISPAGAFAPDSPAGKYLVEQGVAPKDFNSYGSRRGNDRVMVRGTFANIRLRNRLAPGTEGGYTTYIPGGEVVSIYEAAERYKGAGVPTVVLGGRDYGMGSSRDWAAKGTALLGVKVVIAESFERIHRSNLVGMGVLPLEFPVGESIQSLGLSGQETFSFHIDDELQPVAPVRVSIAQDGEETRHFDAVCRLDTPVDVDYYRGGGILQTVLRRLTK